MDSEEVIYTKRDIIEKYKPMFTEWSITKLIRQKKIKTIRIGRRIFISKKAMDDFIKEQEEKSIENIERSFHIV